MQKLIVGVDPGLNCGLAILRLDGTPILIESHRGWSLANIIERVREIGLLKALGMSDTTVLLLYLIQGLLIGFIGGLSGFGLDIVLSQALTHFQFNYQS